MRIIFVSAILVLSWQMFSAGPATAETRYVSDQLVITMRQGMGNQYKIIKTLRTDTPVEVLEDKGRYLRVRTEDGEEGYVLSQYITGETPKEMIIERLQEEKQRLASRVEELETELSRARGRKNSEYEQLTENARKLEAKAARLEDELGDARRRLEELNEKHQSLKAGSQEVLEIQEERQRLKESNALLTSEVERLRRANSKLKKSGMIRWFLAGGGVFLGGWLIGRLSRKKRGGFGRSLEV